MSQATLAEKINISTTHMCHIETGSTKLSLATFVRLTETLKVLADTLLFPTPDDESGNIVADIVRALDSCNENDLFIIRDLIKTYITSSQKNRTP